MLFKTNEIASPPVSKITATKDPEISGLEEMQDNLLQIHKKKVAKVIERIAEMGLPKKNEQFRLVTRRAFNAVELLQFIVAAGDKIVDLKMAVYSINFFAALILLEMIDRNDIGRCEILMSDLRNKAHREKEIIVNEKFSGHPRIDLWFCHSHAKIISCRTESGNFYTIEGSGNHAYNSRIEQYVIDNDRAVYDFTCQWMAEIRNFIERKKNGRK